MHAGVAAQRHLVLNLGVTTHGGIVDQRAIIAHQRIVPEVASGHHVVAIAHAGGNGAGGCVNGDVLADDVAVPDVHARGRRVVRVLAVLGVEADAGAGID